MAKIKVAVVDDSALMRKIISDTLDVNSEIEVVAKFRDGKELIDKFYEFKPDIITLDVEMPIMNGLETLKKLKESKMECPVLMLSSLTSENSKHTIECLELGAIDFIEKPSSSEMITSDDFKKVLSNKVIEIFKSAPKKSNINTVEYVGEKKINICEKNTTKKILTDDNIKTTINAIVIGASTGGPKALQNVLTEIKANIGVPIFVVQHMPKGFTKAFADRLNNLCTLDVVEASDGMEIKKNTIYIAQGGLHMTVESDMKIKLNDGPLLWGVKPAVDKLFESAVNVYGGNLLSIILTGMGRDGAKGTELIKDHGGVTISEDESTCTIYGMPRAAYETGKVDMVLEIGSIGEKINSLVKGR